MHTEKELQALVLRLEMDVTSDSPIVEEFDEISLEATTSQEQ